ncbi:MAG: hypothetical protein H6Q88_1822, partial [Anaeromyxobacteraceae bacterium]|nr:hypothetical protein [Anaeromyxobacteraceae bacterium]
MAPIESPPYGRAEERRRQLLHDAGPALFRLVTNAANATPQGKRDVICIRLGPGTPGMAR